MMTNEDIWKIALQQSAYDSGCQPEDFRKTEHHSEEFKSKLFKKL